MKWPGGKRQLLPVLRAVLPRTFGCYFEPFLGGGALFFSATPTDALLSDSNPDLIQCYEQVRGNVDAVIAYLKEMPNTAGDYYHIRSERYESPAQRAAQFIYLTTLSFNGLFRVNLKGNFNVPYSHRTDRQVVDENLLRAASAALRCVELRATDFAEAVRPARSGDLIYFDPPYTAAHNNNGFRKYNARIFSWDDQVRLACLARRLSEEGCHVIVSNAYHYSVSGLYVGFRAIPVTRGSSIAGSSKHRGKTTEFIFTNTAQP